MNETLKKGLPVLALGMVLGAGGVWSVGRFCRWTGSGDKPHYERRLNRFSRRLNLTTAQREAVSKLFQIRRERMKAVWETVHPQWEEIRQSTRQEIRALLTPAQQEIYDRDESQADKKREERRRSRWDW